MTDGLFDIEPIAAPDDDGASVDRRRTQRQRQAIDSGMHPLSLVLPWLRLHPDADRDADVFVGSGPFTCGSCSWRKVVEYHNRTYPKCFHPRGMSGDEYDRLGPLTLRHSATTDVRRWWPACTDYEPGDPSLSPDAARHIPEETP